MKVVAARQIEMGGRWIDYRLVRSKAAKQIRVRVGPNGIEVVQPEQRDSQDVSSFLERNKRWILNELHRVARLGAVRRPVQKRVGEILYRGESTQLRVVQTNTRTRGNTVRLINDEIVIYRGTESWTPLARSLETWLRKQARQEIERNLGLITERLHQRPGRVYIMGQRTKWGNCSSKRNLSFNWRLILAPNYVLSYLVTHETVHLAIPDHSAKFWLTVQSICPETEKAKQWLSARGSDLSVDLEVACSVKEIQQFSPTKTCG